MSADPTIAVVICTRDRPDALLETLGSIWPQTRCCDELIIMDDGRLPDAVCEQITADARSSGVHLICERTDRPGLTRARNQAARLASSDVLFYLDDDVTCAADCIRHVYDLFCDPRVGGVTVRVEEPRFAGSLSSRLFQRGYQLAAWWCVRPRGRPPGPSPRILTCPHIASPARWLSGAAMALRRPIVLDHPFDENLVAYALGEDREMGYRLATKYWLLESRLARVVHRREGAQRTEGRRFGYMTTFNYIYILRKTCRLGVGDALMIFWSFGVLAAMHLVWSIGPGRREHLGSLVGMFHGLLDAARNRAEGSETLPHNGPRSSASSRRRPSIDIHTQSIQIAPVSHAARPTRRVLFVTNRLEPGGAELMLVALVKRLARHNVQPYVLCLKDAGPLAPECRAHGVQVFDGALKFKTDAAVIPRIRRIIAEHHIDIIVAAHSGGDRMFWSTLGGRLTETPVVIWSHWFPLENQHHFERANRALYRFVDCFVAIGERQRRALIRHEYVPAGRLTVIPNGVELDRFLSSNTSRAEARRRLRLEDHHVAVALIANLRREKRHDVFIAAARRLAPHFPQLRFLIVGDGPHRDAVQASAAASGLDHETLRMLGPRDDIPELLAGIDISCLCSEQECFSVTMLEAAAASAPFIGPDSGCMPEFLEHRSTGLLIKPANASQLADAIAELASSEPLRRALAQEARRKVIARYGVDAMVRSFADLFFTLRKGARPGDSDSSLFGAEFWRVESSTVSPGDGEFVPARPASYS